MARSNAALYFAVSMALAASSTAWSDDSGCSGIKYRSMKPPRYPGEAVIAHVEDSVTLLVTIGIDGVPAGAIVNSSSGNAYLDNAAIEAVKDWRFEPKAMRGEGCRQSGVFAGEVFVG